MLHSFPSELRDDLPLLKRVRVLEYFEGEILTEYRGDPSGGLYLEKWCAKQGSLNRWLVVRSDYRTLARYLAGQVSMLELLTCASDGGGYIVDRNGSINESVFAVRLKKLPKMYLPLAEAKHDESLRPHWKTKPQSFLVGTDWNAELFATIEKKYLEVSAFGYFSQPGTARKVPNSILRYDYDGGFPVAKAFKKMRDNIPKNQRVSSAQVHASSPGILNLEAPTEIADHVANVLAKLKDNIENFKVLHSWSKLKPLNINSLPPSAFDDLADLCNGLLVDIDSIFPAPTSELPDPKSDAQSILTAGKLVAAHWTRLWKVLKPKSGVEFISVETRVEDSDVPIEAHHEEDE